ncbi:hypothetical protein BDQ12DRAFT_663693 [Crucibulum laeve]|uniref:NmrA-like domain-containing protein n=1 Tax=Crucibulum laeve TaxID=68775 RepID=A0A5C3M9U1_9AGAR|nr:hypothetical protein BDQ12DRAFT_663693 [Crucibulum laeve]
MTILITGGTGKTGLKVARILHNASHSVLLTSRSGKAPEPFKAVPLEWTDPSTFENPFKVDSSIDRIYLVGPEIIDMLPLVKPFIDLAVSKGVKHFVFMSAAQYVKGGPTMGKVHEYLANVGVSYFVVRPTWFIDNFSQAFLGTIKDEDALYSITEDGKIRFVSTDDIAEVIADALLAEGAPNRAPLVFGPEALSYDEAAELLSEVLGRKITHKRLTLEEGIQQWMKLGAPREYAIRYTELESAVAREGEDKLFAEEDKIVGKRTLRDYLEENKALWV